MSDKTECCCGETDESWIVCEVHGVDDKDPKHPAYIKPPMTDSNEFGPKITISKSCSNCKACVSESYKVQSDSGHDVYCEHPLLEKRKRIGDTTWSTPDWCPASIPDSAERIAEQQRVIDELKDLLEYVDCQMIDCVNGKVFDTNKDCEWCSGKRKLLGENNEG